MRHHVDIIIIASPAVPEWNRSQANVAFSLRSLPDFFHRVFALLTALLNYQSATLPPPVNAFQSELLRLKTPSPPQVTKALKRHSRDGRNLLFTLERLTRTVSLYFTVLPLAQASQWLYRQHFMHNHEFPVKLATQFNYFLSRITST